MIKFILSLLVLGTLWPAGSSTNSARFNYALDADNSVAEWKGSSPKVTHTGSFAVTGEGIEVINGKVTGGTFVIPVASIKNFDLPKAVKPVLLKHLKSEDFFNLARYPEARFTITAVTAVTPLTQAAGAVAGANATVTGDFTLLGNTHPLSFPARIQLEGDDLKVEATFSMDRTRWGMTHAADPALKNRHIHPEVGIHLRVSATRKAN
jgi:polyisoprenoid-binding protein YceI